MATSSAASLRLLELLASGELTLGEAHEMVLLGFRTQVALADCAAHLPDALGDYARDAVGLVGLAPGAKLQDASRAQISSVSDLLLSGVLYPPWPSFPWWAEPEEPW